MRVRRLERFGLATAFVVGLALTPGTLSGEASRMLVTFLGLFSASLLPTITLLVNGMTANGRSVHAIEKLDEEIRATIDALLLMFGCAAIAFGALMALSIFPPQILAKVPILTAQLMPRVGQGIVVFAVAAIVGRAGQIPAALRRCLDMRKEIAVDEARRKLLENAPDAAAVRASFVVHPDFGKLVTLDDMQGREPH